MIIVMKKGTSKKDAEKVIAKIEELKLQPVPLFGIERTVIAVIGDERALDLNPISAISTVEKVMRVLKPYKLASKEFHSEPTIIDVGGIKIGGKNIVIMAGPCSVESEESLIKTAKEVKNAGAQILRAGAFKPRTGPYAFQGLGEEGLKHLAKAREVTGLKIITEVMDTRDVELVSKYTDIFQIGARNMQNYPLLKEVGKTKIPVLLKRGLCATYTEWLLAAEYILSEGNPNVMLCERGIRTFETHTRNTLDINAVPALKELTHLPVIVDPSHATGKRSMVKAVSRAAIAAGADGLIIEVHHDADNALTDAQQTISVETFEELMTESRQIAKAIGRSV